MVPLDSEVHAVGDKCRGIAKQVDVLMHLTHDFERQLAHQRAIGDQKDRHLFIALPHSAQDLKRGVLGELVIAFQIPVQQDCAVRRVRGHQREAVLRRRGAHDLIPLILDRVHQPFHGAIGDRLRAAQLARNQQHPTPLCHRLSMLSLFGERGVVPGRAIGPNQLSVSWSLPRVRARSLS